MRFLIVLTLAGFTSCSQQIYIVRHAEKATPAGNAGQMERSNPELSADGNTRALALQQRLADAKIRTVYSTNYKRTIQTATPLVRTINVPVIIYPASLDSLSSFAGRIKHKRKGNVLIVGHSNTIDNIANELAGKKVVAGDIPETDYNNLFIITRKGKRYSFKAEKYGQ